MLTASEPVPLTIPSIISAVLFDHESNEAQRSCSSRTLKSCTQTFSCYLAVCRSDDAESGGIHRCVPQAMCSQVQVEMHVFLLQSPWGHRIGQHHKMEWGPTFFFPWPAFLKKSSNSSVKKSNLFWQASGVMQGHWKLNGFLCKMGKKNKTHKCQISRDIWYILALQSVCWCRCVSSNRNTVGWLEWKRRRFVFEAQRLGRETKRCGASMCGCLQKWGKGGK